MAHAGRFLFALALLLTHALAWGQWSNTRDIPTSAEAIQVSAIPHLADETILVQFRMLPEVYLYQHAFAFRLFDNNGNLLDDFENWQAPQGEQKDDELFGPVTVYFNELEFALPLQSIPLVPSRLEIDYQGCLDNTLCYPPQTFNATMAFVPEAEMQPFPAVDNSTVPSEDFLDVLLAADASRFQNWMAQNNLLTVGLLFLAGGMLLAFTPCVFPMVPILSGIIAGSSQSGARAGFLLSLAYVLGMAVPYTLIGLLVAQLGASFNLPILMQHPLAIATSATIFAVLGFAMLGMFNMQMPEFLRAKLHKASSKQKGGEFFRAALIGAISSLIVSPCVTPILAGALVYVAGTGDLLTGAVSLFLLAFGMGVPLLILGTGGSHWLPRAGAWMVQITRFFGFIMLGVALWLLARVAGGAILLLLSSLLCVSYGLYLWRGLREQDSGISHVLRGASAMIVAYGALLLAGAVGGAHNPLEPLTPFTSKTVAGVYASTSGSGWEKMKGRADFDRALAESRRAEQRVLVDFFAEWCVACKILEEKTLNQPDVLATLAQKDIRLIKLDVTTINAENQRILADFNLIGLPSLVFFSPEGGEIPQSRIQGEMSPEDFIRHLDRIFPENP